MNFPATLRENFSCILKCSSCSNLPLHPFTASSIVVRGTCVPRSNLQIASGSRFLLQHKRRVVICRVTETESDPESNDDKEKEIVEDGNVAPSPELDVQNNGQLDSQPTVIDQNKEDSTMATMLALEKLAGSNDSKLKSSGSTQIKEDSIMATMNALEKLAGNNDGKLKSPGSTQIKEDSTMATMDALKKLAGNNDVELKSPVSTEGDSSEVASGSPLPGLKESDNIEVASGSPLPGLKQLSESYRIPKETIDIIKDQVFGFDTFFVTSYEPYETGILFKGNLRGTASKSFERIKTRMEDKFGDEYKLFLLINPEDDVPVAVVVPKMTLQPESTAVPEWVAAGAFGLVTVFTLLLRNVPELQTNLLSVFDNVDLLRGGLSGAFVTACILGVHELGHILVARSAGIKLGVPYFIPSWQIGSFGGITRIINIVPNREDLLKFAAAGPVAGFSLGFALLLLGFFLPPSDGIGVVVDGNVFHESFLVGGIAKFLLGDVLREGTPISINPLVIWAWAGLLINAINSIPAGELDGGRVSLALWGRKASNRLTGVSIALLGLSSLFNDVSFYWVVLIFFLQRGPIAPLSEEISDPDNKFIGLGITVLTLGLLVCLPYPFPFTTEDAVMGLRSTIESLGG
ncbi:hypothetical protein C5167_002450 [Papaver somniferum]|uniref:Peptidase M50 domain-containing protein n=1 Tax=Papaver somniferum TaxID=3469 RepID=A0A4Y7KY91_PAPSO|nr:probable zinc metalloprotease EGY2, chloroplastic isoform X1 [Papaver somniferum]RZC78274.1 hypothetical protein C5167_002450 [Papaver somniferum]